MKIALYKSQRESHTIAARAAPGDLGLKSHPKDWTMRHKSLAFWDYAMTNRNHVFYYHQLCLHSKLSAYSVTMASSVSVWASHFFGIYLCYFGSDSFLWKLAKVLALKSDRLHKNFIEVCLRIKSLRRQFCSSFIFLSAHGLAQSTSFG